MALGLQYPSQNQCIEVVFEHLNFNRLFIEFYLISVEHMLISLSLVENEWEELCYAQTPIEEH